MNKTENDKKEDDVRKVHEIIEQVQLSGLTIRDLLNPKFVSLLDETKFKVKPFMIALDLSNDVVIINHNNEKEMENKMIHIESKSTEEKEESKVKIISDKLKLLVK